MSRVVKKEKKKTCMFVCNKIIYVKNPFVICMLLF